MTETSKTIELKFPITADGVIISGITISRAKAKHIRAIGEAKKNGESEEAIGLLMLSLLSGLPVETIDELDVEDFAGLSEVVASFFPQIAVPITGEA